MTDNFNSLVYSVKHGDVLLFSAWYVAPENNSVIQIYQAAKKW